MLDAAMDLVLGSACAGCARPGRVLCRDCASTLPDGGRPAWPTPTPPGLALPLSGGEYAGLLKVLVNAHKERHLLVLARPLGDVLSRVVLDLLTAVAGPGDPGASVLLVPVPSAAAVVRQRGQDPMLRVARVAAAELRRTGVRASVGRLLVLTRRPSDQAGLGAEARAENLAGTMACRRPASRAGRGPGPVVVLVDDVITTGATLAEAQRALAAGGLAVAGSATVAATRRRSISGNVGSLPILRGGD